MTRTFGLEVEDLHIHLYSTFEPTIELPDSLRLNTFWKKLWNYIKTLLFIFVVFIAWFFLGFTATHAFPVSLVKALTGCLFIGFQTYKWQLDKAVDQSLNSIWHEVKSEVDNIATSESVIATGDREEAIKLNRLDSKYWLLLKIIELLSSGVSRSERDVIDRKLNELDEQRDFIYKRLHSLKNKYYKIFNKIQAAWAVFYSFTPFEIIKKRRDYNKVEKILNDLDINYTKEIVSQEKIQEMLEILDEKSARDRKIKTLQKTLRLFNWVYSYIKILTPTVSEDPQYQNYPVRARLESRCYHLPNGCEHYPRIEKPEHKNKFLLFKTVEEAKQQNLDLCKTCQRILKYKKDNNLDL